MKKHNKYAVIGLAALQRAADKVAEKARKHNCKIPVWRNGRIEHEIPGPIAEQRVGVESEKHGGAEAASS